MDNNGFKSIVYVFQLKHHFIKLKGITEGGEGLIRKNKRGTKYIEKNGVIIAKECTKCNEILNLTNYVKATSRFAGVASSCKQCSKEYFSDYYKDNKEKVLAQTKKYYSEHREEVIIRTNDYRKENPEVNKRACAKWYSQNKSVVAKYKRTWRTENLEACKLRETKWRLNNKNKVVLKSQRRRALKKQLPNNFTNEQHESLLAYFEHKCPLTGSIDIHIDHFIPLAIGHGGTTLKNMVPLDATLNICKHAQNPFEWFKQNHNIYKVEQKKFEGVVLYLAELNEMTPQEYEKYVYWCFENPQEIIT
ncbi:hypothetical protein [Lysinibacillus fusiformis]|uniref:hypothetical protein n=1 Tax=Lysinibacillus fusiformis TaxID=28031 RepID=UPI003019076F